MNKFFIVLLGVFAIVLGSIIGFLVITPETSPRDYRNLSWPMFKHDAYRTGNLRLVNFSLDDILFVRGIDIHPAKPEPWDQGLSEVRCSDNITYDGEGFQSSPIFVDIDLDGNDEVISYFKVFEKNKVKDAIIAIKYKKQKSVLEREKFGGSAPYIISWKFILPKEIHTSFAAGDLNKEGYPEIAFGCDDGNLYVLNKEGKLLFKFKTNGKVRSTPAIFDIDNDKKQEIIFGSDDGYLYAIDNEGNLKWKFKTQGKIQSSPTIYQDGTTTLIIFGSDDGFLYVIGRYFQDYELYCAYKTDDKVRSSPLAYKKKISLNPKEKDYNRKVRNITVEYLKNGRIVFGSDDSKIYIIDFNCNLIKSYKTKGKVRTSPAIFNESTIVIGSADGNLYFFNENEIKNISLASPIYSTPAVINEKAIVFNSKGELYIVMASSKIMVRRALPTENFSCSLAIGYIPATNYLRTVFSCFTCFKEKDNYCVNIFVE